VSHRVVGTAGHIDHGKSALVRALTGVDPDRLKEEKRRGITIELGFVDFDLGEGRVVSFVDVPGHERFVRHMVAGAAGIDAVLMVVAADQGVQPQTREHLEICSLLGVRTGLLVLSKCDLVSADLCEVVALELRELAEGTFLEGAPILPVSARTGEGLDRLVPALARLFDELPPRPTDGVARLPVDRSFVLKGFGTVATGTLMSGRLHEGQELEVLPGSRRGRVRGLQVHGRKVAAAEAGCRTAVNLQGLDRADVPRGSTLTTPGALLTTQRIWARVALLPSVAKALAKGGAVRFHQGTAEGPARLRSVGRGEDGSVQAVIRLAQGAVLAPGDRFILRRPAPLNTVGGGVVLDVRPARATRGTDDEFRSDSLEPGRAVRARLRRAGLRGCEQAALCAELGWSPTQLHAALAGVPDAVRAAGRWFEGGRWRHAAREAVDALGRFHAEEPLRLGLGREALRAAVAAVMPQEAWREMLGELTARGDVRLSGDLVALASHQVELRGADRDLAARIEQRFREAGLEPPTLDQVVEETNAGERAAPLVNLLVARGELVRIQDGRLFHAAALADLRARLREHARTSRTIDVGAFKQLAGVTRRNAIPLLEQLDAERTTRRVGDLREILI
jgi:selenocysteine-specific elongation factor